MRKQQHDLKFGFEILMEIQNTEIDEDSYERGRITKHESEQFTEDAIILQSILEYSIDFGTENYFKSRDLIKYICFKNANIILSYIKVVK